MPCAMILRLAYKKIVILPALLLSHPKTDIRDTSEYQPFLKERRSRALKHLAAEFLDVKIRNGEHCPIEDARAVMMLYQRSKKERERSIKDYMGLKQKPKKKRNPKKKLNQRKGSDGNNDAQ